MKNDFARIITLLRKERKLSQKKVAKDLGISQALLSHYENGVRNCSIELLCQFADYYDVSCDYLTGKTTEKHGAKDSLDFLTDNLSNENLSKTTKSLMPSLNKKVLVNSINVLYSMLDEISNKALTNEISTYLNLSVYKMFRELYLANPKNVSCFFSVPEHDFTYLSDTVQKKRERNIDSLCKGIPCSGFDAVKKENIPCLSYDEIENKYPQFRSSLMNLIKSSEEKIIKEM